MLIYRCDVVPGLLYGLLGRADQVIELGCCLLRCMSLLLALNRLAAMSDMSPLLGAERT